MRSESNYAGGVTLVIKPEESLSDVPKSHQALITAEIKEAFAKPAKYFLKLAARSKLTGFRNYLQELVRNGQCALLLGTGEEMMGGPKVGFQWWVSGRDEGPRAVTIEPGQCQSPDFSRFGFEDLFTLVRWVHWREIGFSGGLADGDEHPLLSSWGTPCKAKLFPPKSTKIFGSSGCGDLFIYNANGEAGYLSHENGKAYSLGTVSDALNWIFDELRQGHEPEFDYERVR